MNNRDFKKMTEHDYFINLAGAKGENADTVCIAELQAAGIKSTKMEVLRSKEAEVRTAVMGEVGYWGFTRVWNYWVAEGPALPLNVAKKLHKKIGKEVRVEGHCGAPDPFEYCGGFGVGTYHIDTQEGLKALADAIKSVIAKAPKEFQARFKR